MIIARLTCPLLLRKLTASSSPVVFCCIKKVYKMYADGINMHKEQKLAGGQKKVSAAVTGSFCSGNG